MNVCFFYQCTTLSVQFQFIKFNSQYSVLSNIEVILEVAQLTVTKKSRYSLVLKVCFIFRVWNQSVNLFLYLAFKLLTVAVHGQFQIYIHEYHAKAYGLIPTFQFQKLTNCVP